MKLNSHTQHGPAHTRLAEPGEASTGQKTKRSRKIGGGTDLLTRAEMASVLGMSVRSFDRIVQARLIPMIRIGGIRRFQKERVIQALTRNCELKEVQ